MRLRATLAALLSAAACTTTTPLGLRVSHQATVVATPSGSGVLLERRPSNCDVEFFRLRPPDRPFDEVATLHFGGGLGDGPLAAQDLMRAKACSLGAHAVVVTRDHLAGSMTGTAIAYRGHQAKDVGQPDPAPAKAAGTRPPLLACRSLDHPLQGWITRAVELHASVGGSFLAFVDRGTSVCAAQSPERGRRSVEADGRVGWVADGAVEIAKPTPAPARPGDKPPRDPSAI